MARFNIHHYYYPIIYIYMYRWVSCDFCSMFPSFCNRAEKTFRKKNKSNEAELIKIDQPTLFHQRHMKVIGHFNYYYSHLQGPFFILHLNRRICGNCDPRKTNRQQPISISIDHRRQWNLFVSSVFSHCY